jgi:surfeit locus 1 family protein
MTSTHGDSGGGGRTPALAGHAGSPGGAGIIPASPASGPDNDSAPRTSRSPALKLFLAGCAVILFMVFFALGSWQVKRLFWKLDLIERVDARVHAAPVAPPGPDAWRGVDAENDAYRHVRVSGVFLDGATAKVQATTELGGGFWLMTPLRREDGTIVFVNRGFISSAAAANRESPAIASLHDPASRVGEGRNTAKNEGETARAAPVDGGAPAGRGLDSGATVTLTGLLRISEPGGGYLRNNDPVKDLWYSRDVAAIAASRSLTGVAPYFIDAAAGQEAVRRAGRPAPAGETPAAVEALPVGGLTVIRFANSHLVYAITWFAMALMVAGATFWVVRDERRRAAHGRSGPPEQARP